jgi:hypothetical protein
MAGNAPPPRRASAGKAASASTPLPKRRMSCE